MINASTIAICVATYKRPLLLKNCLQKINELELPAKHNIKIIIVDNDVQESARGTVLEQMKPSGNEILYFIEPVRGIVSARNRMITEAIKLGAELIAFIDDDEFPQKKWLLNYLDAMDKYQADVAAGPVVATKGTTPVDDIKPNKKIVTGDTPRHIAAGNVIFKSDLITRNKLSFDMTYNFSGGEDFDFFDRSRALGNKHIWVADALIFETILPERTGRRYLFFRHFTGAINNVMQYRKRHNILIVWIHYFIKAIGKIFGALFSFLFFLLSFKRKKMDQCIIKLASALGYISGSLNIIVERYR